MDPENLVKCGLGIDIAKDVCYACAMPENKMFTYQNTPEGIKKFVSEIKKVKPDQIVLEPTGQYSRATVHALLEAGFYVVVMNPRNLSQLMDAEGRSAKTDKLDAYYMAIVAKRKFYQPRIKPTRQHELLREYSSERTLLVEKRTDLKNKMSQQADILKELAAFGKEGKALSKEILKGHEKILKAIDEQIERLEKAARKLIQANEDFQKKDEILRSVPGISHVTSALLIGILPELGQLNRGEIANLCGVAPLNNDSGRKRGVRRVGHGRYGLKRGLYTPITIAMRYNPTIKAFAARLQSRGLTGCQLKIACIRKLITIVNQMLKTGQHWGENQSKPHSSLT